MSEVLLYRTGTELRADTAGRSIFGLVVPYGQRAEINDLSGSYTEMFIPGAFARSIAERGHKIKLLAHHDQRQFPVGRATSLVEQDDGLHGAFAIPQTREGDDVLELVRRGTLDSFSVGFIPIHDRQDGDTLVRTEAALREVSLVSFPAYENASIAGIRAAGPFIPRGLAIARFQLLDWLVTHGRRTINFGADA
jgi:HK97 family phage prohead protease